jgi:dihydrodipicolinate synthase/N-acetylneuraminate lyase
MPEGAARLVRDGLISWIKYAIVRENPSNDPFLSELIQKVDPKLVVSGIGEQPAIEHLRDFGCNGFTSGCVCVAPALSRRFMEAVRAGDFAAAQQIRDTFRPLEDLRNEINPVRVLHEAVALAGISATGELLPLLSGLESSQRERVAVAAKALLQANG